MSGALGYALVAAAWSVPVGALGFGVWAAWVALGGRAQARRRERRLERIATLVGWWREQDQDYRGQVGLSPHELLAAVQALAEGKEVSRATWPALYHECGCPITMEDHGFIPPSIIEAWKVVDHVANGHSPTKLPPPPAKVRR